MVYEKKDYRKHAKENEKVFRNVLRNIRDTREKLPAPIAGLIPDELNTELPLKYLYQAYSRGDRYGKFTICDFKRTGDYAALSFENVACMSGGGGVLEYIVNSDDSVRFKGCTMVSAL